MMMGRRVGIGVSRIYKPGSLRLSRLPCFLHWGGVPGVVTPRELRSEFEVIDDDDSRTSAEEIGGLGVLRILW